MRFQGEAGAKKPAAGKNNFFANIDNKESNWSVVEMPQFTDGGMQADDTMSKTSNVGPKESCWQCYKLFPAGEGFHCDISGKNFKTKLCLQKYEHEHIITCQLKIESEKEFGPDTGCKLREGKPQKFLKVNGHFHMGKWFCAAACSDKDDDCKLLIKMEEERIAKQVADDMSSEGEIDL